MSQQAVSADIIPNSATDIFSSKTEETNLAIAKLIIFLKTPQRLNLKQQKSPAGTRQTEGKPLLTVLPLNYFMDFVQGPIVQVKCWSPLSREWRWGDILEGRGRPFSPRSGSQFPWARPLSDSFRILSELNLKQTCFDQKIVNSKFLHYWGRTKFPH